MSNKPQKIRVKPEGEHSNHPKKWEYMNLGYAEKRKSFISRYGGTCYLLEKKLVNKNINPKTGESINRTITIIK